MQYFFQKTHIFIHFEMKIKHDMFPSTPSIFERAPKVSIFNPNPDEKRSLKKLINTWNINTTPWVGTIRLHVYFSVKKKKNETRHLIELYSGIIGSNIFKLFFTTVWHERREKNCTGNTTTTRFVFTTSSTILPSSARRQSVTAGSSSYTRPADKLAVFLFFLAPLSQRWSRDNVLLNKKFHASRRKVQRDESMVVECT